MSTRYFSCSCHLNPETVCRHDNDPFNARRMRTDFTVADFDGLTAEEVQAINEGNQRYNDFVEGLEEMNIAIAMRQMDDGTYNKKPRRTKRIKRTKSESLSEEQQAEILADLKDDGYEV